MTLVRRALSDLLGAIDWRWLGVAGIGTMAATFVVAAVEPPESVSSVALGATGTAVLLALVVPTALRHGARQAPPPTESDSAAAAEPDVPPAPVPAKSADVAAGLKAENQAQPRSEAGGATGVQGKTEPETVETLDSFVRYRDLLVILDTLAGWRELDPRTGLIEERDVLSPERRPHAFTTMANWLALASMRQPDDVSTLLVQPLLSRFEYGRPRLFDPDEFEDPSAARRFGYVPYSRVGGTWVTEFEQARESLRHDVETLRRPKTPGAAQKVYGGLGTVRAYGGGEAYPVKGGSVGGAGTYRCARCGNTIDVGGAKTLPPCPTCGNTDWRAVKTESHPDS